MVVIAIISLLAAVAVPAYKTYTIRANIASLESLFNVFGQQVIFYNAQTGNWPIASMLGYQNTVNGGITLASPAFYSPYLSPGGINIENGATSSNCSGSNPTSQVQLVMAAPTLGVGSTWPSGALYLYWTTVYYTTSNGNVSSSVCGCINWSGFNCSLDYSYLPAACQQQIPTVTCS